MYKRNRGKFKLVTRLVDDQDWRTDYSASLSISGNGSTGITPSQYTQPCGSDTQPDSIGFWCGPITVAVGMPSGNAVLVHRSGNAV